VVSPTLTTSGVKRKLNNKTPERRSHEATKAVDLRIHVDLSRPLDRGYWKVSWKEFEASELREILLAGETRCSRRLSVRSDVAC
jgi:hypothetical protein